MATRHKIYAASRYAPLRYESSRTVLMGIASDFWSEANKGQAARSAFIQNRLANLVRAGLSVLGPATSPGPGQGEMSNLQVYAAYKAGGRVIFDFSKRLTEALLNSDVQEIPLSALHKPAQSLYLHFGQGVTVGIDSHEIEGAFVAWLERPGEPPVLTVDFVSANQFTDSIFWFRQDGEPLTGCSISLDNPDIDVITALEESVHRVDMRNKVLLEQNRRFEEKLTAEYGEIVSIPSPISRIAENLPLLKSGMALVINCLLYLSAEPDDRVDGWDDQADPVMAEQSISAVKPGTRKTATRTLEKQGYSKIQFVGRQFAAAVDSQAVTDETGRTVVTHFRRGHFRNQAYGPKQSLRKVIFIPPVVVNQGQGEALGRIYEI